MVYFQGPQLWGISDWDRPGRVSQGIPEAWEGNGELLLRCWLNIQGMVRSISVEKTFWNSTGTNLKAIWYIGFSLSAGADAGTSLIWGWVICSIEQGWWWNILGSRSGAIEIFWDLSGCQRDAITKKLQNRSICLKIPQIPSRTGL